MKMKKTFLDKRIKVYNEYTLTVAGLIWFFIMAVLMFTAAKDCLVLLFIIHLIAVVILGYRDDFGGDNPRWESKDNQDDGDV